MSIWNRMFGKKDQDGSKTESTEATAIPLSHTPPGAAGATNPLMQAPDKSSEPVVVSKAEPLSAAKDRVVRVFVSSTFKDMIEDRNELMSHAWPILRKLCRGRAVEFVEVDLRWGVTEEQEQRKETLRHCLAEIKRCKPYFIGLLGERYGWTPGPEAFSPALLDEEDWLKNEVAKHSVTELEILHGVLNAPDMAGRAFFYFRDPKYAQVKGGNYMSEDAVLPTRQDVLKQKVKAVCQAKNIPLRENYADQHALATLILADLTAAIDAEFPPDQVPDVWAGEDRDHEVYAKSRRTKFYVGRNAYYKRLDDFALDGAKGCGLTVLGESGGGKSALLANWIAYWRQMHPNDFVFQHYIGSSAMSAGHLAMMRRLMITIIRWCNVDALDGTQDLAEEERKIPATSDEIVKAFPDYLSRLSFRAKQKGVRAILVLDALNQLEDRERGRLLGWLPYRLPGELRLIVSALPGDTLTALHPRAWPTLTIEPLTPEERINLIARYLSHFSQGLSESRAKKIAGVSATANPLYLKTLLDDLRATGAHDRLDEQIADYLKATDIPALFGKILSRYEHDYERDRPGLVREALSLLWAARRGLTEPELLELLKPAGIERLPAAIWSPVRCVLDDGLVDRDGVLTFAHDFLRKAVATAFVPDLDRCDDLRLQLADYFEAQPITARTCDELPWLLWHTESFVRLRACLLDIDRFLFIQNRDENELLGYWVGFKEADTMGHPYVQVFNQWSISQSEKAVISYTATQVIQFLFNAGLYKDAEPLIRLTLEINEQIYGQTHPTFAISLSYLAQLFLTTNRLEEAELLYRRALLIAEQIYGENHLEIAKTLNNLAMLLMESNHFIEAESLMRRALKIAETSNGENHPDIAKHLNNLGLLLKNISQPDEAERLMRRALKIAMQNHEENNPDVAKYLGNLAGLLEYANRLTEAEPLYRQTLIIAEKSCGENHPDIAKYLSNLAGLLHATNRLTEAEPLYRQALKIAEQSHGGNHPEIAKYLNKLAGILQDTSRVAEAELLMRRALNITVQSRAENHPDIGISLSYLANFLCATNRFFEAEPLFRSSLKIAEHTHGGNHREIATSLSNLAMALYATHQLTEAEPLMRRALMILENNTGGENPNIAKLLNNLGQLLRDTNRLSEAELLMRRALMIDEQNYGEYHPDVGRDLHSLATVLYAVNRFNDAELLIRRALEIFLKISRTTGYPHPHLQVAINSYASLLQAMGRSREEFMTILQQMAPELFRG